MTTSDRTSNAGRCPRDGNPVHWDPVHGWLPFCWGCLAGFKTLAYREQHPAKRCSMNFYDLHQIQMYHAEAEIRSRGKGECGLPAPCSKPDCGTCVLPAGHRRPERPRERHICRHRYLVLSVVDKWPI